MINYHNFRGPATSAMCCWLLTQGFACMCLCVCGDGMTFKNAFLFGSILDVLLYLYLLRIVILFQCVFDLNRPAAINCCCRCLLPQMRTNARLNFEHNLLNLITITYVFTQPLLRHRILTILSVLSACACFTLRSSGAHTHTNRIR